MTHTPGPWTLHRQSADMMDGDCDWSLQTEKDGAFLLFCNHPDAPAEANAQLIAAAPDMLAALQEILPDAAHGHGNGLSERLSRAKAAIQKATGTPTI